MSKVILSALMLIGTTVIWDLQAQQMVDPTRPQNFKLDSVQSNDNARNGGAITVSAVFIFGERKTAVINGDTVIEGQSWQGNKVKKVHEGGVVLVVQGRETELLINQHSIKKDASNDF